MHKIERTGYNFNCQLRMQQEVHRNGKFVLFYLDSPKKKSTINQNLCLDGKEKVKN